MLHQGQEFYTRLVEHLMVLQQNIEDFKNARGMQATDVCKQLGIAPGGSSNPPPFMPQNAGQPKGGAFDFEFFQPPGK